MKIYFVLKKPGVNIYLLISILVGQPQFFLKLYPIMSKVISKRKKMVATIDTLNTNFRYVLLFTIKTYTNDH